MEEEIKSVLGPERPIRDAKIQYFNYFQTNSSMRSIYKYNIQTLQICFRK